MRWIIILISFHFAPDILGQTLPGQDDIQQNLIEGLFEDYQQDDGGEIQPEWLLLLEDLVHHPMNLNVATEQDLRVFFFLEEHHISRLLAHRQTYGPFIHIHELQTVEGLDLRTVRRLLPFTTAGEAREGLLRKEQYWHTGRREFTFRVERFLESKRGFQPSADGGAPPYEGDPNRLVGRLRYFSGNQISYGISFEKDAGEAFGQKSNPQGFDFYSAHFYVRRPFRGCSQLLIGDYGLNLGQGLLISTGFGAGKSAQITMIKRTQRNMFPMNSWQESRFFRGFAAEWHLQKHLYLVTFASLRHRDGNVVLLDTTFSEIALQVSSFQQSGFHRTAAEIADEGIFKEIAGGASLSYRKKGLHMNLQGVHFQYDPGYFPSIRPYNTHFFRGDFLNAGSFDYQADLAGNQIFGEIAMSHNGGWAATSGLLSSPDRKLQLAFLGRHFTADYWNIWGSPMAESALPRNESGFYAGFVLRPKFGWRISTYVDLWKHQWLTFQSDSPVRGREHLIRLDYEERRKWQAYLQFRWKGRDINQSGSTEIPDQRATYRQQLRLQIQYDMHRILALRTRMEWSNADPGNGREDGFLIAQDLIYKPVGSRWSGTMRFALFRTDGYASRIYMFENDLLYTFGLRPYYHTGQRFYINMRYRPINNLTLEARYESYKLFDQEEIGTGNELISGPIRSGFKAQVRWMF